MSQPMNPYDTPEYAPPRHERDDEGAVGDGDRLRGVGVVVLRVFRREHVLAGPHGEHALTQDPEEIRRLTDQIVKIEIPESLPPKAGMDLSVPIVGTEL